MRIVIRGQNQDQNRETEVSLDPLGKIVDRQYQEAKSNDIKEIKCKEVDRVPKIINLQLVMINLLSQDRCH